MHTVSKKILLAMVVASLAACGGGDGGDDSGSNGGSADTTPPPAGSGNITGTPTEGNVKASNSAVFNLSGVVTLMEYEDVVDQESSSAQTFSLSGLTSTESSSSSGLFTTLGASNLLGINENGETVFPVANVEPLMVDYSLLSPDQKKLYIAVSSQGSQDWQNFTNRIYLKNADDDSYAERQPLIGPALESSVPLTMEKFREFYPEGVWENEYGPQNSDGSCETGVKADYNVGCVTAVVLDPSSTEDPIRIEIKDILTTLEQDYFSCSLVEVDRQGGPMDCVGGTTIADAIVEIFGISYSFKLRTAKFNRGDSYYGSYGLDYFESIRPGLRPLQFDDAGNLYTLTSRFNSDFGYYSGRELTKITPAGELEQVIGLDSVDVSTFLALSNGNIVTSVDNYNNSGARGIYLIQNGTMIPISDDYSFQADTGSTFIIGGKLYKALPSGAGFTSIPIKYKNQNIHRIFLSDEGELYGCDSANWRSDLVKVYPYKAEAIVSGDDFDNACDFSSISFGHRVAIEKKSIGTLGSTEVISILRLADGKEFEVFAETDYIDKPRYDITNLAFGGNKIIFSADRTTAPIGTILGEIDITLLGQGATVEEYMKLNEVQSSVAASNTVRKITPLPVIESGGTASAPRIIDEYFDPSENSHVGFEFSEFMNKDTVLESMSLKNNGNDVEYIPFWGYKKLYLIADTDGLGDSNGDNVIDEADYQPYSVGETYDFDFNVHIAQDVAGRTMATSTTPNASHGVTF